MRKWILMLMCVLGVQTMVWADNDKPIQIGQLPTKAQTFITTYFKNHKVALAKMESGLFYKSYDVIFTSSISRAIGPRFNAKRLKCPRRLYLPKFVRMWFLPIPMPRFWKSSGIARSMKSSFPMDGRLRSTVSSG